MTAFDELAGVGLSLAVFLVGFYFAVAGHFARLIAGSPRKRSARERRYAPMSRPVSAAGWLIMAAAGLLVMVGGPTIPLPLLIAFCVVYVGSLLAVVAGAQVGLGAERGGIALSLRHATRDRREAVCLRLYQAGCGIALIAVLVVPAWLAGLFLPGA